MNHTATPAHPRPGRLPWADLAILGVAVIWGASYPVAKGALLLAPVLLLIFYRFLATTIVMGSIARRELRQAARRDLAAGAMLGALLFCIFAAETWGVTLTSATNTALIISLCTLFTPFIDFGLARRLPPAGILAAALLAISGVALLAGQLSAFSSGDALVLLAAVLRALMVVATRRAMQRRALSSTAMTAIQASVVMTLSALALLLQGGVAALRIDAGADFWLAVGFLSLFCTIAAFYIQNAALRQSSPTRVSFLMGTEPLFGVALAWLLLGERLSLQTAIGALLIVAGTFLGMLAERRADTARVVTD